jgi:hypothetical protein
MRAFADALDCVPMALAENSGLSPIETLAYIKSRQAKENNTRLGVDCMQTGSNGKFLSCASCAITSALSPFLGATSAVSYIASSSFAKHRIEFLHSASTDCPLLRSLQFHPSAHTSVTGERTRHSRM